MVFVDALDEGGQEHQELGVLPWGLAGAEQILAGVCCQGPVVVLAGAVDPFKGLFVEQAHQIVLGGALLHDLHNQLVGVAGVVGIGVDGRQLMLAGCALVVLGLGEDAQPPQLFVQILHEVRHTGSDGSKIVVVQLLSLGGLCAEQSSPRNPQIFPLGI